MRFQVPQFIEVEDTIFGPFTLKQFIYLAGGGGVTFIFITFLPLFIALVASLPFIALSLALAFYKINNRPFIEVMESAFNYVLRNKLYIWEKRDEQKQPRPQKKAVKQASSEIPVPKLSESKLKDLAWSLDIKESIYSDSNQR